MDEQKLNNANKQITSVTYSGIACNVILAAVKIIVGFLAASMALVADGVHSLSDMITDVALLLGIHFGSKAPDAKHPYGHGRMETFAGGFIGIALAVVGGFMIYRAAAGIAAEKHITPTSIVLVVAIISIIAKEFLYRITKSVALRTHSPALYANAWHHRSDALSSIVVVIGFISIKFGFIYGDQVAAAGVGLMIILVALRIISDCLRELTEGAVDETTIEHIKQIINSDDQIRQWHKLRTRRVGREVFLDLHILVDRQLNIAVAHEIAENLENSLHDQMSVPINIVVHVEPDIEPLRK